MKKYYNVVFPIFLLLVMACSEKEIPEGMQLSLVYHRLYTPTTSITFGYDTDLTATLTVTADNTGWELTGLPQWLSASATSGNGSAQVVLTAQENTSVDETRAAVLTVQSTSADHQYSKQITVTQPKAGAFVSPKTVSSLSFSSMAGQQTIEMTSNIPWSVLSAPSWVSCSPATSSAGSTTVTVSVADNPEISPRSGSITLGNDSYSSKTIIEVSQEGKSFSDFSTSQLTFSYQASTQTVDVQTDGTWTATASASWIHLSPASGKGNGTLQITVDESMEQSQRKGTVSVSVGQTTRQITVVQESRYIRLSFDDAISDSRPCTVSVSVSSNAEWTVSSNADWLTATPSQGSGNATLQVAVADNPHVASRTGILTFTTANETKTLSFTQPGRKLSVSTTSLSFTEDGGTSESITVTTDGTYAITPSDSWITVNQSGNTFTLTVSSTSNSRTGSIVVSLTDLASGETLNQSIAVRQIVTHGTVNGHDWVDLGLSVRWATTNVGASSPENYGDYFAWGETTTKSDYSWSTYKYCNGSYTTLTKYCTSSDWGTVDNKTTLEASDDAATANWGGKWRMPTYDELYELLTKCTWTRTMQNGINGNKVTGTNGNSIFLPAASYRHGTSLGDSYVYCWSSSLSTSYPYFARNLCSFDHSVRSGDRCSGFSVRPVTEP